MEQICSTDPLWTRQNEVHEVRPCVCPLQKNCPTPQSFNCIAYCYPSFENNFDKKYSHFAIFSSIHGIAIPFYEKNGRPITTQYQKRDLPSDTILAIDIEFITDKDNDSYAARVALMAPRAVAHDTNQRTDNNLKNLVFHALIRHEGLKYNKKTAEYFHINPKEHIIEGRRRTCAPKEAMDYIKDYFKKYPIVFKKFNSDFIVLLCTGLPFDQKNGDKDIVIYDIERFYRRLLTDKITGRLNNYPFSLKWLNQYFLFNKSQSKGAIHCPVEDSRNTLTLFKKLTTVIEDPTNSTGTDENKNKINEKFVKSRHALNSCKLSNQELIWFDIKEKERMRSRKEKIHWNPCAKKPSQMWSRSQFKTYLKRKYSFEMSQKFDCDLIDDEMFD